MYLQVSCSACGHRSRKFGYDRYRRYLDAPDKIVKAGWGSFGSALYCPKCAATWEERNGKDRPMWGNAHTRERVLEIIAGELHDEIERRDGTWEP